MECGRLRNRITIQKGTETADAAGQPVITWADWSTCWSKITPLRGTERVQALQLDAKLTHKVSLRYSSTTAQLEPDLYRIRYGKRADGTTDRILDINAVINVQEKNVEIELHCTEAV